MTIQIRNLVVLILLIVSVGCTTSKSSRGLSKQTVLETMRKTNQYFMDKWPDAGKSIFTNIERPSNIWTRAVYYEGLMAFYSVDPDQKYIDYALQWGEKHRWGLRGGINTRNADNQCCGQTYLDLYLMGNRQHPERLKDIKSSIDLMLASPKIDDWTWIDALQMGMPVFVKLGNITGDTNYFKRMYEMYAFTKNKQGGNGLYNPIDKLWWRDKDFVPPYKEPNGADCYWSRGNGWVVAALARTLDQLPKSDPHYSEYLQDFKDIVEALLPLRRKDGFWNVSLEDPNHFGGKELSGTALFLYGMAWGINQKIIDEKKYKPVIETSLAAILKNCIHPNGKLGYVQGTGKEPKDGQPVSFDSTPDFEDYGLGCFLLAGTEYLKMK
jgi:unsaturated rhamnogalacturonyl hydrolase